MNVTLPLVIAVGTGIVVAAFVQYRRSRLFQDYKDIAKDVRRIRANLKRGQITRDGIDLLVIGELRGRSTLIRFSHSESAPAVYIGCQAPVNFSLSILARTPENSDGDNVFRTGNPILDLRLVCRTDNRIKSKQLLTAKCQDHIQRLCCSSKTMLGLSDGNIEFSEALLPSNTASHLISHLESIAFLNQQLSGMGNAVQTRPTATSVRHVGWIPKLAFLLLIVTGLAWAIRQEKPPRQVEIAQKKGIEGISASKAALISNQSGWKKAAISAFEPNFATWLRSAGGMPDSELKMDASGNGSGNSVAYLLEGIGEDARMRRVVWIVDKTVICDFVGHTDGVVRLPKNDLTQITWAEGGDPAIAADGDGLLIVRDQANAKSATVYFLGEGKLHTGIPADYRSLSVR